jgi:ApaG protein
MSNLAYQLEIQVQLEYLAEQSSLIDDRYVFAYKIRITNQSNSSVQLLGRHWIIQDANQRVQDVRGQGVIGQQPLINPNESFEYSSGVTIATPVGTMHGSYQMVSADGQRFEVPIPQFKLVMPRVLH